MVLCISHTVGKTVLDNEAKGTFILNQNINMVSDDETSECESIPSLIPYVSRHIPPVPLFHQGSREEIRNELGKISTKEPVEEPTEPNVKIPSAKCSYKKRDLPVVNWTIDTKYIYITGKSGKIHTFEYHPHEQNNMYYFDDEERKISFIFEWFM